jgi:hypothetical protein
VTADEFRALALRLPEASEHEHMAHPDFRVGGKIFATLGYPDIEHAAVMLTQEAQREFVQGHPAVFTPASGAWGAGGATQVRLAGLEKKIAEQALLAAWRQRAPKRIAAEFDSGRRQ